MRWKVLQGPAFYAAIGNVHISQSKVIKSKKDQ